MFVDLHPVADAACPLRGYDGRARTQDQVQYDVAALRTVFQCPLDQRQRLHRGMSFRDGGPVDPPYVALVAVSAPVVLRAFPPAIPDRLVASLVISPAEDEPVL